MEPTGADSPSQNGAVKVYNDKLAIRTRTLSYGAGLLAKFWLAALLHSVYLHNRLVHTVVKNTPYKGYFGFRPDIGHLKLFGSCVCIKRFRNRQSKLDKHDFEGIFLGYTATDHSIVYLDLDSGLVKRTHHLMKHGTCRRHTHLPVNSSATWVLNPTTSQEAKPELIRKKLATVLLICY